MKRRRGKIRISNSFLYDIDNYSTELSLLFSKFIPIESYRSEFETCTFYYGVSECFDEIEGGSVKPIPEYEVIFTYFDDHKEVEFKRL